MPLTPLGDIFERPSETALFGLPSDAPTPSLGFSPVVGESQEVEAARTFPILSACRPGELNDADKLYLGIQNSIRREYLQSFVPFRWT